MRLTRKVSKILNNYKSDNPGVKANLARILMHGKLGGTGKLIILPVERVVDSKTLAVISERDILGDRVVRSNLKKRKGILQNQ